ncbi:TlpA family protein disulfide reductase [Pontibacter sp. E15-1]|uniref:peroxiredoxin family protein n=1 Tax=Pontibacter sp. E15-1 TaxID=2919918 RepID=UPI001F4FE850|nr:TlpA disulfide reductase family protein [Pontibacter sp. E15-1]MCJ8166592.1 TlpA family protein disulfide reductase [Pontibacter sp. E15-1]
MKHYFNHTYTSLILLLAIAAALFLTGCSSDKTTKHMIQTGMWRVALQAQGQEIPFLMEAEEKDGKTVLYLINGEERILLDDIQPQGDSVKIKLHIFDADLIAKVNEGNMQGRFVKNDTPMPYSVPFTAEHGKQNRFEANPAPAAYDFGGKWEVVFTDKEGNSYNAIGVFEQNNNTVTGTFLTETGDYRYLEGQAEGKTLRLSTFDGNHAYLFTAKPSGDSTLLGEFYSGMSGYESWTAKRNANAKLASADTLTYLKEGYETLSFTFPNLEGKPVSLSDEKYRGKVVLVQLLGSWCPNCLDETQFLIPYYNQHKDRGMEIIGLGFERSPEFGKAAARLQKMKSRLDINYDLLVAGISDKEAAAKALPALNHVLSFPTTIFIGRDGKVRKIHTGFSGPGTGAYYDEWVADFNKTMETLLEEK